MDVDHREFVAVGQRPLLQGEVVFLGEIGFLDFVHGVRVGFAIAIRGEQFGPGGGPMVAAVERDRITERVPVLLELHRDGLRTVSIRVKVVAPPFGHGYGESFDALVLHTYRVAVHRGRRLSAVGHMVGLAAFDGESDRVGHPVSVRSLGFGQRVLAVLQLDGARGFAGGPDNRIDVMSFEIGAFDAEFRSRQFGGSADFDLGELHVGLAGTVDHGHVVTVQGRITDGVPIAQDRHLPFHRNLEHDVLCRLIPFRHFALMQRIGAWGEREFLRDDIAVLRQFSFAAGPADRRDGFAADGGACDGELRAGDFAYAIGQAGFGDRHLGGLVFVDHHDRACFVHIGGSATGDDFDNGFRAVGAHLHGEGDGRGRQISVRGLGFGQRVCAVLEIEFRRRAIGFPFDRFELLTVGGDAIFRRQFQLCTCDFSAAHVAFGDEHFAGGRRVGVRHRIGERAVLRCVAGDCDGVVLPYLDFLHGIGDLSAVGVFRQIRERCAPLVVCIQRHGLAVHRIAVGDQLHGHVVRADLVRIVVVFPDLVHLDLGGFRRVCVGEPVLGAVTVVAHAGFPRAVGLLPFACRRVAVERAHFGHVVVDVLATVLDRQVFPADFGRLPGLQGFVEVHVRRFSVDRLPELKGHVAAQSILIVAVVPCFGDLHGGGVGLVLHLHLRCAVAYGWTAAVDRHLAVVRYDDAHHVGDPIPVRRAEFGQGVAARNKIERLRATVGRPT